MIVFPNNEFDKVQYKDISFGEFADYILNAALVVDAEEIDCGGKATGVENCSHCKGNITDVEFLIVDKNSKKRIVCCTARKSDCDSMRDEFGTLEFSTADLTGIKFNVKQKPHRRHRESALAK